MARSAVHKLINKTKTTTLESLKGQYKNIKANMTGKRLYKEVKAKHDLIETGLRNEIDCDAMDQNCYDELYMTPNIEKSIPGKHANEMSFTLKDDAGVKLSASGSSHEQTPFRASCDIDSVREILNKQKDCEGNKALMLAVSGGHKDLVRVLIEEFQFSANTSENGKTLLHEACCKGHTDLVRELIVKHGADLSAKDNNKNDALMYAVIGVHQDLVRVLIKEFNFNANTSRGENGRTPLLEACYKGHIDLVRELVVEHGADLGAKDNDNNDALMYAVIGGHQDLVRVLIKEFQFNANMSRGRNGRKPLLGACFKGHIDLVRELVVEHGADLSAKDNNNNDALMYAVIEGHQDLVRVLIKEFNFNANTSRGGNGSTPLLGACFRGHIDLMRELIVEHGADLSTKDNDNNDALKYAVSGGHQDLVRVLIKEFQFSANMSRGRNGRTPLLGACFRGHTDLARELVLEHGADLGAKDNYNWDALMNAVYGGQQDLVRVLIKEFHFNANTSPGSDGRTPLHQACIKGHTDLVRQLVVEHGADLGAKDNDNCDALMYAVIGGHQDLVRVLIKEFHFNANTSPGSDGRTPLHQACIKGHTDLLRQLAVEHEADLSAKSNVNYDALMYAVAGGHKEIVKVLINDFGFRVNGIKGYTPLLVACKNGHTGLMIKLVYDYGAEIDAKDADGNNALMYAVIGNHPDIAELCINDFWFDVNAGNFYCCTPLLMAFYHSHIDLAMDLIYRFEADVNAQDMYGHNCLMYAAQAGSLTAANFLLNTVCMLDVNTRGHCGETPLLVACYYGHISFVTYLFAESDDCLDLEAEDEYGNNALMYAVVGCQEAAVRFLVEDYFFDVNSSNHALQTPVIVASMEGNVGLLNILVKELGASILCEDENGETAFSIAVSEGQQNIIDLLVSKYFNDVEKWLAA